jgi:hypothetical protein
MLFKGFWFFTAFPFPINCMLYYNYSILTVYLFCCTTFFVQSICLMNLLLSKLLNIWLLLILLYSINASVLILLVTLIIENLLIIVDIILVLLIVILLISDLILLLMRLLLTKYYIVFAYDLRRLITWLLRIRIILRRVIWVLIIIVISNDRSIVTVETIVI